ncbi:hypothetical protein LOZ12_002170 [Ophidiomyces ophidiicola]|uniref:Uncharacterized protein n=1 Tax=Ophidiomyces ophidiicola TaxID=1387563 RepID=A0ACB8UYG1_9EURO|nr:hypothetical protein LOZ64_001386 [Ophidiomyces ophidiicola]KAI1949339.1 hypothetical protein LOZ62_002303 [Ophidiomyces ophidiicola]KAI1970951.1 hypothetical protein LOZ56_003363 [Ophidiomyces ophidiicola]KAI2005990.1 hypothetical protein LOZ50_003381 [Ophidiomyces ophidiicola]KAI2030730.1 hypothetical protein LOZ45_001512 [Ophidiomyces ophidiicola]
MSAYWTPDFPYSTGQELCICSHTPPPPINDRYPFDYAEYLKRRDMHPVDVCLLYPPAKGVAGKTTVRLQVLEEIRTGSFHGSQVVSVNILDQLENIPPNTKLVAKFYDPLYIDGSDYDDVFYLADRAYSIESAVYQRLHELQGRCIPRFYGSFTMELWIPERNASRSVRLILVEKIPGVPMNKLSPDNFTQEERQSILKQIIDIESEIYARDIVNRDLEQRNIIISTPSNNLTVIDFGHCRIDLERPRFHERLKAKLFPGMYISPLLRWGKINRGDERFPEWMDWDWQTWLDEQYAATQASITSEMWSIWGLCQCPNSDILP